MSGSGSGERRGPRAEEGLPGDEDLGPTIDVANQEMEEPDPDIDPAGNARFWGYCRTCNGGQVRVETDMVEPEIILVTCWACGGSGRAEDEKLCPVCRGDGCTACTRSGYAVECRYDPPCGYYWTDPLTTKRVP